MKTFYDLHFAYFIIAGKDAKLTQITPSFKKDSSGSLILLDEEYLDLAPSTPSFAVCAIKTILRSILLSFRFIQSGDLLLDKKFYSLSVFSYYTASFHILQSFLALHGRIIVRPTDNQRQELGLSKALIMSRLTKHNRWCFEGFSQNHDSMWREASDIFEATCNDILKHFLFFFEYIIAIEQSPPSDKQQLISEGLKRFPKIRHEAIYEGYGFDDYVFNSVISDEKDRFSLKELESKAIVYKMFASQFLKLTLKEIFEFKKTSLDNEWDKVKDLFLTIILIPPFEKGDPDFSADSELSCLAKQFNDWLK
ncbi:MAG: hypothetical protein KKH94_03350 [Candidatus Omnitrophica bacterium]|nr:hypothetical protein [Candidatus Omnitrophota bacterium]